MLLTDLLYKAGICCGCLTSKLVVKVQYSQPGSQFRECCENPAKQKDRVGTSRAGNAHVLARPGKGTQCVLNVRVQVIKRKLLDKD